MKASSSLDGFPAKDGIITEDDVTAAWCADEKNDEQWLEVDLQEDKDVMAIALQGRYEHSWVKTFYIQHSSDKSTWYCYGSENGHKVNYLMVYRDVVFPQASQTHDLRNRLNKRFT